MSTDPTELFPPDPTRSLRLTDDFTRTRKQTVGSADDPADLPPVCGRFAPAALFKEGGMGRVFAAVDAELNREVAFKWMKDRHARHSPAVELFVREAELTGRLEHPGVAPVYGFGRAADGRPYYAMRLVRGPTLDDAVARFHAGGPRRSLTADDALALRRLLGRFLAVCQTVAFAHSNGVIHRDLKPGNIVLGPFGETVVLDWGLARPEAGPFEPLGMQLGTPAFWAPEQELGRPDEHDRRTDVWGLGAVLYAVLTGRPPNVKGQCPPTPPVPSGVCPWVDGELDGIVTTALAEEKGGRFPTADALAGEVERWLAEQPTAALRTAIAALRARNFGVGRGSELGSDQLARNLMIYGVVTLFTGRASDAIGPLTEAALLFGLREDALEWSGPAGYKYDEAFCQSYLSLAYEQIGDKEQMRKAARRANEIYAQFEEDNPHPVQSEADPFTLPPSLIQPTHPGERMEDTWVPDDSPPRRPEGDGPTTHHPADG